MAMPIVREVKRNIYGTIPYMRNRLFDPESKKNSYYKFIKDNGYTHYPYSFADKYLNMTVMVSRDESRKLKYITHQGGKKLYFPSSLTDQKIEKLYKSLLIEQDCQSAHLYVDSIEEFRGKTILDVGSAEGFTSLEAIEVADFIFLFECQDEWIDALTATFDPWKEKVKIIKKFVSNKNSADSITLDEFLKDKSKSNLFLKMDIEGEERNALEGCKELFLSAGNLEFAICTYHLKDDPKVIADFLNKYNCTYAPRDGFFYTKHSLRTGLFRGHTT